MITFSEQAWDSYQKSTMPKFYFDVKQALNFLEKGQTPWTPCLSVLFALDTAVAQILTEGVEEVFRRHERLGEQTRSGVVELGLELFPDARYASNAITAVNVPDNIDGESLVETLRVEHNMIIGGGQGSMKGKIIRIGHMGYCFEEDVDRCLNALSIAIDASCPPIIEFLHELKNNSFRPKQACRMLLGGSLQYLSIQDRRPLLKFRRSEHLVYFHGVSDSLLLDGFQASLLRCFDSQKFFGLLRLGRLWIEGQTAF